MSDDPQTLPEAAPDQPGTLYRMPAGAAHVSTPAFALAQTVAARAVATAEVAGFFGEPGTGKTHALRYFTEHTDVECAYITAQPSPGRKEIFEEILLAITGSCDDVSARHLRRQCNEVLAERPRALIIDECQHLSYLWHQQLRSLHDDPAAQFALLLAGGADVVRNLKRDPQLWSRIEMRVTFEQLRGQQLLNTLAAYHPVFANTDTGLLADIDARDCDGYFRNWYHFLKLALPLLAATKTPDRLSPKVAKAVLAMRGIA